jgi:hypothetical protein
MIIGKVKFTVEYTSWETGEKSTLSTVVEFDDRGDTISYFYSFHDLNGMLICARGRGVHKNVIGAEDPLNFSIKHASYNIDNFLVRRKRIFRVLETSVC